MSSARASPLLSAYATPAQPFGWPTQKYQYFYKVTYPLARTGTQATMLRNMRDDLLPPQPPPTGSTESATSAARRVRRWRCAAPPTANTRARGDVALAAAQSATVSVRRGRDVDSENDLYMKKVRRLLRRCLLLPGNFSGFARSPRDRIDDTVARLHYDKFEMRKAKMAEKKSRADLRRQAATAADALYGAENVSVLLRGGGKGEGEDGERGAPELSAGKRRPSPDASAAAQRDDSAAVRGAALDWSDVDDGDNDEERPYVARFPRSRDEPRGSDVVRDVSSDQLELIVKRLVRPNDPRAAAPTHSQPAADRRWRAGSATVDSKSPRPAHRPRAAATAPAAAAATARASSC